MKHKLNLTAEKVQALCIANNYCTAMDNANYSTMLHNVDRDNKRGFGPVRLARLAQLIKLHSDTAQSAEAIAAELKEAGAQSAEAIAAELKEAGAQSAEAIAADPPKKAAAPAPVQNLKTNSLQARLNVRQYICQRFDASNYTGFTGPAIFQNVAPFIWQTFNAEKPRQYSRGASDAERFEDWCSGLPSVLDTCYYYNRSALDDVAQILQQTPERKSKYTEQQAEKLLTLLIFREIEKEVKKNA